MTIFWDLGAWIFLDKLLLTGVLNQVCEIVESGFLVQAQEY